MTMLSYESHTWRMKSGKKDTRHPYKRSRLHTLVFDSACRGSIADIVGRECEARCDLGWCVH